MTPMHIDLADSEGAAFTILVDTYDRPGCVTVSLTSSALSIELGPLDTHGLRRLAGFLAAAADNLDQPWCEN